MELFTVALPKMRRDLASVMDRCRQTCFYPRPDGGFMLRNLLCTFVLICSSAFTWAASPQIPVGPDSVFIQDTAANEIKIMSYNLLNLFDADKEEFSDDWMWLPKNYPGKQRACQNLPDARRAKECSEFDWTYEKVEWKLNQIKKVVDFQGSQPDMLAVMEIENENVIRMLANKLGYKHYLITTSADKRGIDVGLLFNPRPDLTYVGWEPLYVKFASNRPGRDIMRVDFNWKGRPLSVYVNHWPSQRNPTDERVVCAKVLAQNVDQMIQTRGPQWHGVAVGDFNTIDADRPNPFNDVIHSAQWNNHLFDAEAYARQSTTNPSLPFTPPGSYYYGKEDVWNHLDRVVITQNLADKRDMEFVQDSFRIPFPEFMSFYLKRGGKNNHEEHQPLSPMRSTPEANGPVGPERVLRVPNRYNFETLDESKRGFSDHLPMIFKLRQ